MHADIPLKKVAAASEEGNFSLQYRSEAMHAEIPQKKVRHEVTCPFCLHDFIGPVTLECGHSFCQFCIRKCWEVSRTQARCPHCSLGIQGNSNSEPSVTDLAEVDEIAEIANDRKESAEQEEQAWPPECERHHQPLDHFCKDDHTPLCVECRSSQEYIGHNVVPVEKAAQEYKVQFGSYLKVLLKERERNLKYKEDTEDKMSILLIEIELQRQQMMNEFRRVFRFLNTQERLLLDHMEELEDEIIAKRNDHQDKLCKELSSLERNICQMEEKCQLAARKLLLDVRNTSQRYEEGKTFGTPMHFPPALECKIWKLAEIAPFLEGVMKPFKETLEFDFPLQEPYVTLDPDTAHRRLILSEDRRNVRWSDESQEVPDKPERFDNLIIVLGHQGFTAGRQTWVVTLGDTGLYAVGVVRKSVLRKGYFKMVPENGLWAIGKSKKQYRALGHHPIAVTGEPKRIRVILNYPGQRVAFYDEDRGCPIYAFSEASFSGEALFPFFLLGEEACLALSS